MNTATREPPDILADLELLEGQDMVYTIGTRTVTDEGITVRLLDTALVNRTLGMIEAAEVCPSENITASAVKVRVEMLRGDELSVLGGVVGGGISASFPRLKL